MDDPEVEQHLDALAAELAETREWCLARMVRARVALEKARAEYESALMDADSIHVSYTEMARAAGISEAAVRLYIKRRKVKT